MLANLKEVLENAREEKQAIAAFNVPNLEWYEQLFRLQKRRKCQLSCSMQRAMAL